MVQLIRVIFAHNNFKQINLLDPSRQTHNFYSLQQTHLIGINLIGYHSAHPDNEHTDSSPGDTKVIIQDGELLCGIVCKKTVGTSQNSLIHVIWKEHGPDRTRQFFDGCQCVVNYWLLHNGFSIGIGDTIADSSTMATISSAILLAKARVAALIRDAQSHRLLCLPGMTIRESFESKVNQELNKARDHAGASAQQSLRESNNVKQMVIAGSKGSFINISQVCWHFFYLYFFGPSCRLSLGNKFLFFFLFLLFIFLRLIILMFLCKKCMLALNRCCCSSFLSKNFITHDFALDDGLCGSAKCGGSQNSLWI